MRSRHGLLSLVALALVLASLVAMIEREASVSRAAPLILVLGASVVGGLAPRHWWWAGPIVGSGVPVGHLLVPVGEPGLAALRADWLPLVAPALALASAGLGVTLARVTPRDP